MADYEYEMPLVAAWVERRKRRWVPSWLLNAALDAHLMYHFPARQLLSYRVRGPAAAPMEEESDG